MTEFAPQPPPAAFRHLQRRLRDPEEFEDAVSGVNLRVDFLRRAGLPAQIEQFQAQDWALDTGETNLKAVVRGSLPEGWVSFCFVRGGDSRWGSNFPGEPGWLLCTPPGEELDGNIRPGFKWAAVALPLHGWNQCQILAGAETARLDHFSGWPLSREQFARIEQQLIQSEYLLRSSLRNPLLGPAAARAGLQFARLVAGVAWKCVQSPPVLRDSLRNRAHLARRAEQWLRDHFQQNVRIPDLCLALGVSRRELEYAFRTTLDESPREHLHKLRLNAIHRALQREDMAHLSILQIALDHGISHPGRFAANYRSLFGVLPSALRAKEALYTERF